MPGIEGAYVDQCSQVLGLGPARESAQSIVAAELKRHNDKAIAWAWLQQALENCPPQPREEAALWDLLSRARGDRY